MTPEETEAMAKRIEANRKEAKIKEIPVPKTEKQAKGFKKIPVNSKEKPKAVSPKKVLKAVKAPKKERTKPVGKGTLLFKYKPKRSREVCDVLSCREKPKKGFRCEKHRKMIRKAQLKANNVVWKKRVKEGTAGHHVVYTKPDTGKTIATKFSLKATDKATAVVKSGHSIIGEVGKFKAIVAATKKASAA